MVLLWRPACLSALTARLRWAIFPCAMISGPSHLTLPTNSLMGLFARGLTLLIVAMESVALLGMTLPASTMGSVERASHLATANMSRAVRRTVTALTMLVEPVKSLKLAYGHVSIPSAALTRTALRAAMEFVTSMGSVTIMAAVGMKTVPSIVMDSVDLMASALILENAALTRTVVAVESVQRISPAPYLTVAKILTALNTAMESVGQTELAHTQSAALTRTANMLTVSATFLHLTTVTSVTTVMMGNVNLDVLMMAWEALTVPTLTQPATAMCAAAQRMLSAITMTGSAT